MGNQESPKEKRKKNVQSSEKKFKFRHWHGGSLRASSRDQQKPLEEERILCKKMRGPLTIYPL